MNRAPTRADFDPNDWPRPAWLTGIGHGPDGNGPARYQTPAGFRGGAR